MANGRLHGWLERIVHSSAIDALCEQVTSGQSVAAQGSRGSSTALVAGALAVRTGRLVLLLVAHPDEADDAVEDLAILDEGAWRVDVRRLGALEVLPGETGVNLELLGERLDVVSWLAGMGGDQSDSGACVLVGSIQAVMQGVPRPESVGELSLTLEAGRDYALGQLLEWLSSVGYERVEVVEQPGQFASRGGIVDVYLPAGLLGGVEGASGGGLGGGPVRVDFFGDTVESITMIDPETMGSGAPLERVRVIGARADQLHRDSETVSVLSLLPDDAVVVMHEPLELAEQGRGYYERLTNPRGIYSPQSLFAALNARLHVEVNQYGAAAGRNAAMTLPVGALTNFDHSAAVAVRELGELASGLARASGNGDQADAGVVVLCQNTAERDRLRELLTEHAPGGGAAVRVEVGYLHRGFVWGEQHDEALHLVGHHELFHRYHVRRRVRPGHGGASGAGRGVRDVFLDVEVGDYVVHVEHGIARYEGMRTLTRKSGTQEYLTLTFAQSAQLHVPASQIELVQKYIGGFHGKPPLSLLGGKRWSKQKQQVAEAVKDLAAELLRVQAARSSLPGISYGADTPWQRKFEAEFPYDETQDQLAAIAEIKRDMSAATPMDRLICGDVGFGKTELAVRAAFKAVEQGKQVAILVPTTVLAEQHERTFCERMADYPFCVASISRFKTAAQVAAVLADLARGAVDVIIGTHRLLSGDVKFADLGLVVIDEEQRFGVEHKHKLMRLRLTVDVLTLSATPIPRTLHMSMLGLRDISSLSTPPLDRRAIMTEVVPYDAQRIKQAIVRELNREGQVYFVHNRVHNIGFVADEVQKLVPEARVAVGHGQMGAHELEEVMLRFMRREVDVLVCTTIIESGLDIPTANTIFINGADRFGLADLHQLRGRVGRYKHRAYCYLLLPDDRPVTETASRRLRAIEQYSMLGAGFKIAMRDLEIRGAGNLLGAQQSGHIAAVGYEMYCQLLEQAARRLRQEPIVEPAKTHLELPVSGYLPKRYIGSDKFRIEAYRRLGRAVTLEELEAVTRDLTDAYGEAPRQARVLLELAQLRVAATLLGIESVKLDGPDVIFATPRPGKLEPVLTDAPGRVSVIDDLTVYWRPPKKYLEPSTLLAVLRKVLVGNVRVSNTNSN